ncbi:MAG: hypothetical protein AB1689_25815 [Thermodesulfobacteriota bacterium]
MPGRDEEQRVDGFPLHDEVEDFAGRKRRFVIDCDEGPLGFTIRAREVRSRGEGYEFGAYSETSPWSALASVRRKMHRALATRHLSGSPGAYRMLHDRLRGRITWSSERGTTLVVDGIELGMDELDSLLASHEGFTFELRLADGLD